MIKLSLRLKAIADFVDEESRVLDIGCDHGLLDIYLALSKNCVCLASDISKKCLLKAQNNIKKYNLEDKIKTKVSDGLKNIDYKDYDYIIISGMGFQTIKEILKDHYPKKLIIQSNNNIEELRYSLLKKYIIKDEKIVLDNGIYYIVLSLEKGHKKYKYADYILGLHKDNFEYIDYLYSKCKNIYIKMPKKYIWKRIKLYRKILVLKKYIKLNSIKNR